MDMIEKKMRTKAWVHYVASCVTVNSICSPIKTERPKQTSSTCYGLVFGKSDTSQVHLLERRTGVLAQNWSRYRTGERDVGQSTLKRVEQKIPGSLDVHNVGPEGVPLWTALWSADEQALWKVAKSISRIIQFHQSYNSDRTYIYDYTLLESTKVYFAALTRYFEGLVDSNNKGLFDMEILAALIAAFRLGQYRREAANYQEFLGHCLELSLTEGFSVVNILRGYGIYNYLSKYVDKLIPHAEKHNQEISMINRKHAISNCLSELEIYARF